MTDLRTAAKTALWAFQCHVEQTWPTDRSTAAIAALRAALAQQEEPCPNCASLEAQNTELDRKLAELEQAYENGYKAGAAAERKRIIQFLNEMQRQVGDGHNYYGVAAMRIRERV